MHGRGYSDPVNHAFAFAAKHHDRQVRKGTKLPYLTQPASVAVILTRYGCDEETVVSGILHDVIEDCVRDGMTTEMLSERIGQKFGEPVLSSVLSVTYRKLDEDGVELSVDERRKDYLERLARADVRALWVCAADKLHTGNSILSDLRRTVDQNAIWSRFSLSKEKTLQWYRDVHARLIEIGFSAPIVDELGDLVKRLDEYA